MKKKVWITKDPDGRIDFWERKPKYYLDKTISQSYWYDPVYDSLIDQYRHCLNIKIKQPGGPKAIFRAEIEIKITMPEGV